VFTVWEEPRLCG